MIHEGIFLQRRFSRFTPQMTPIHNIIFCVVPVNLTLKKVGLVSLIGEILFYVPEQKYGPSRRSMHIVESSNSNEHKLKVLCFSSNVRD